MTPGLRAEIRASEVVDALVGRAAAPGLRELPPPVDQAHPTYMVPARTGLGRAEVPFPPEAREAASRWQERWGAGPVDWHMRGQHAYAIRNRLDPYARELAEYARYLDALMASRIAAHLAPIIARGDG